MKSLGAFAHPFQIRYRHSAQDYSLRRSALHSRLCLHVHRAPLRHFDLGAMSQECVVDQKSS